MRVPLLLEVIPPLQSLNRVVRREDVAQVIPMDRSIAGILHGVLKHVVLVHPKLAIEIKSIHKNLRRLPSINNLLQKVLNWKNHVRYVPQLLEELRPIPGYSHIGRVVRHGVHDSVEHDRERFVLPIRVARKVRVVELDVTQVQFKLGQRVSHQQRYVQDRLPDEHLVGRQRHEGVRIGAAVRGWDEPGEGDCVEHDSQPTAGIVEEEELLEVAIEEVFAGGICQAEVFKVFLNAWFGVVGERPWGEERTAEKGSLLEESSGLVRVHVVVDGCGTGTLSHQRELGRITAEGLDVTVDPAKCSLLIFQAVVAGYVEFWVVKKAQNVQTVVDADYDDFLEYADITDLIKLCQMAVPVP